MGKACTLLAALLAFAALTAPAQAHDSQAPRGAPHSWLPDEPWAMQHWMPFDEARLYEVLGTDNLALERWLRNDHHTIAQLGRARTGLGPRALARELVDPLRQRVGRGRAAVLELRTRRVLTQGHLAQHMLYHYFHGTMVLDQTRRLFGVGRRRYLQLRDHGWTPLAIARRGGRSHDHVVAGMRRVLAHDAAMGVRERAQTTEQAAYMLRRRTALLSCWLHRPHPKFDPGNPFGDPNSGHGPHTRGRRNGLLPGSKQLTARRRPGSCWHEPPLPTGTTATASAPASASDLCLLRL